jgi:hypothetical protein
MSLKYTFVLVLLSALPIIAQTGQTEQQIQQAREQTIRDAAARGTQEKGFERLRNISNRSPRSISLVRRKQGVFIKYKPALTAADIQAVQVHEEDLQRFNDFLQLPKTGIVRIHSADVCTPNKNIIQAESSCPNNVAGKATGYSFRLDDYNFQAYSDIFFSKNTFSAPGIFTIGIFSRLGDNAEIGSLTTSSEGVKQLVELNAPESRDDVKRLLYLMKTGAQVAGRIYKSSVPVKINETYVLRSIAYRGEALKKIEHGFKINVLDSDERSDVLIVFRPVRKHDDGSVTLIWKELARKSVPKIVLKESEQKSK